MSAPVIEAPALEPLDLAERNTLQYNEAIIAKGKKTFIEVADALARIRDGRLYRESHDNFASYCREKWGMSRVQAHRLIVSSEAIQVLPMGNKADITSERQARELAKIPEERRAEVIEKAKATGRLTAKAIREAAEEVEIIPPKKRGPETKRFDEFQKLHIEQQFFRLARKLAKVTAENHHTDLLDAATKGINDGIRWGAEWRKEARQ